MSYHYPRISHRLFAAAAVVNESNNKSPQSRENQVGFAAPYGLATAIPLELMGPGELGPAEPDRHLCKVVETGGS